MGGTELKTATSIITVGRATEKRHSEGIVELRRDNHQT